MSTFSELMGRVKINIASPDGTVKLLLNSEGTSFVLTKDCLSRHSEKSLSAVVDQCLAALSQAYEGARDRVGDKVRGGASVPVPRDTPEGERLERFWAALAAIRVQGTSPRGYVTMDRANGRVTTEIAPRTLMRCNTEDTEAELNAALSEVSQRHMAAVAAAYSREYFNVETATLPPFLG